MVEKEPAEPVDSGEVPAEAVKPGADGPQEIEDAARQEAEYPADETHEG